MIESLSAIEDMGEGHKWIKLAFDLIDVRRVPIGAASIEGISFIAVGCTPSGEIGFEARIPLEGWDSQTLVAGLSVDWGHIILRSIGARTDRLLHVLEGIFGLPISESSAARQISCAACFLGDDPAEIEHEEMHTKLFFNGLSKEQPDTYAEFYFNFDLAHRRAYLMEKDAYYRMPVIGWFSGRYRQPSESLH
jgi:hypothetical protein